MGVHIFFFESAGGFALPNAGCPCKRCAGIGMQQRTTVEDHTGAKGSNART